MEKLLKSVNQESWNEFKREANHQGLKLGKFLHYLVQEHKKSEKRKLSGWDYIFSKKKGLSDHEANSIKSAIATFENEYGFES